MHRGWSGKAPSASCRLRSCARARRGRHLLMWRSRDCTRTGTKIGCWSCCQLNGGVGWMGRSSDATRWRGIGAVVLLSQPLQLLHVLLIADAAE